MKARLEISRSPTEEPARLADLLAQDLSDWPAQAWVCFDDYHFACDSDPAEHFVEQLLSACSVRLIVTSRSRPKWATTRRVLYGEIFELGRNQLAMTADEAECALHERSTVGTEGFLSLSDGWPALLGLATLSIEPQLSGSTTPEELFASFAQELYAAAAPDIQQALRRLALAPYVTLDSPRHSSVWMPQPHLMPASSLGSSSGVLVTDLKCTLCCDSSCPPSSARTKMIRLGSASRRWENSSSHGKNGTMFTNLHRASPMSSSCSISSKRLSIRCFIRHDFELSHGGSHLRIQEDSTRPSSIWPTQNLRSAAGSFKRQQFCPPSDSGVRRWSRL